MSKSLIKYIGASNSRYANNQQKAKNKKQFYGMDARVFVNKDSPDYRPSYGKTYTERQLRILNEEIPLEEIRLNEITVIMRKAESLGDDEKLAIARVLYNVKTRKEDYRFSVSVEDAKQILQELTPWDIDWKSK